MGKVLIAINTAGFFLNVLVFLMVVNLSGGGPAAEEKPSAPPAPGLDAIASKVEQIVDKKLSKLTAMDSKLQSLSRDVNALTKKVTSVALAQQSMIPSAAEHVEPVAPEAPPPAAPALAPATGTPAAPADGNAAQPVETKPEEKPVGGEKSAETPPGGQP